MSLCNQGFVFNTELLGIASLISAFILGIAYIASKLTGDEKINIWVKEEVWNLIMNGFVVVMTLGFISLFSSNLTSGSALDNFISSIVPGANALGLNSNCLYEEAYKYSVKLLASSLSLNAISNWINVHLIYLTRITSTACSSSYLLCLLGAPSVNIKPFADLLWLVNFLFRVSHVLFTTVFLFAFSQGVLIKFFISSRLFEFLALMLVMRMIPATRTFANVLFALVFAFFIFYPLLIVLEGHILGIPPFTPSPIPVSISEASKLSSLYVGSGDELALLTKDAEDMWKVEKDSSDPSKIILKKNGNKVADISLLLSYYAQLLFVVVLFGSINLIVVSLVVKTLLHFMGESNNLMEMFIRMSGIVTW